MESKRQARLLLLTAVAAILCLPLHAQKAILPPTAPTTPTTPPPAAAPKLPSQPHRATVTLRTGLLSITADDSSLNQILREISRKTGLIVTGGVADERVYGSYGPDTPEIVLASLLAGTGSNIMIEEGTDARPMQLVLTPRQGGASPPSPQTYAAQSDDDRDSADTPPQQVRPVPHPAVSATPTPPAPVVPASAASASPTAGAATQPDPPPSSPNGVKTPQQIYDQLIKLQQQKSANPTPP